MFDNFDVSGRRWFVDPFREECFSIWCGNRGLLVCESCWIVVTQDCGEYVSHVDCNTLKFGMC